MTTADPDDDEIVVTWREIHRKLYSHVSLWSLMQIAPELKAAGVVGLEYRGRPPNRHLVAWTYPSIFKSYIVLRNQKRDKGRQ
jgi:hypothetical protein